MATTTNWGQILSRVMNPFFKARPTAGTKNTGPELPSAAARGTVQHREQENKRLEKIVEDIESDYQFKFARETLQSLVTTNKVAFVAANGSDQRAQTVAANLQQRWDSTIVHAFQCFSFGRAAFEKCYAIDQDTRAVVLSALDYLPFADTEMKLSPEGEFLGIKLGKDILDPSQSWWLALDPTPKEPHGRSRYIGAPARVREWRRTLDNNELIWYSRFAIGQGVGRFPEPSGAQSGQAFTHPRDAMGVMLDQIKSGGTLLLSSQQYANVDGGPSGQFLYDYTPSEGLRDATALVTRRQSLDVCVLRSMSIPEMALTNPGQTGTFAMAEAHQLLLDATADGILSQIVESYKRYVVDKVVALNGGAAIKIDTQWTPLVDKRRASAEKASQKPAQPQFGGPFGSFAISHPANPPANPSTDEQIANRGIRGLDDIYAELEAFISDRDSVRAASQNIGSEARRRL